MASFYYYTRRIEIVLLQDMYKTITLSKIKQ